MEVHGHFKSNKLFEHAYKSFLYKTDVEIKGKKKKTGFRFRTACGLPETGLITLPLFRLPSEEPNFKYNRY